jgi:hypothetical protein
MLMSLSIFAHKKLIHIVSESPPEVVSLITPANSPCKPRISQHQNVCGTTSSAWKGQNIFVWTSKLLSDGAAGQMQLYENADCVIPGMYCQTIRFNKTRPKRLHLPQNGMCCLGTPSSWNSTNKLLCK